MGGICPLEVSTGRLAMDHWCEANEDVQIEHDQECYSSYCDRPVRRVFCLWVGVACVPERLPVVKV